MGAASTIIIATATAAKPPPREYRVGDPAIAVRECMDNRKPVLSAAYVDIEGNSIDVRAGGARYAVNAEGGRVLGEYDPKQGPSFDHLDITKSDPHMAMTLSALMQDTSGACTLAQIGDLTATAVKNAVRAKQRGQ